MNYGQWHEVFTNKVKGYDWHTCRRALFDCHDTLALHKDLPTDDPYSGQTWAHIARGSAADADANFVLIEGGHIAEVQATAEGATYDEEGLLRLLRLARIGCDGIFAAQAAAVGR